MIPPLTARRGMYGDDFELVDVKGRRFGYAIRDPHTRELGVWAAGGRFLGHAFDVKDALRLVVNSPEVTR